MKFKNILKYVFPFVIAAIAIPVALTSCSTNNTTNKAKTVTQKKFKSEVTTTNKTTNLKSSDNTSSDTTLILDPNANPNAMNEAQATFKTLDQNELQTDFNNVLTKFFKTYEYEAEFDSGNVEIEIESDLEKIEVKNYNPETLTATLSVTYEVEKEVDSDKKDEESKTKVLETQEKTLQLKPQFATYAEIKSIEKMLIDADKKDSETSSNFSTDIDDLIELYIGDKEDNEKSIFEQVEAFSLQNQNKLGGLLGYEIKLSDLSYTPSSNNTNPKSSTNNTNEMTIFAPSSIITEFYVPDQVINGIDLTFDYSKLSQKTIDDVKKINSKETLNEILMVAIPSSTAVQSVAVTETVVNNEPSTVDTTGGTSTPSTTVETLDVIIKFGSSNTPNENVETKESNNNETNQEITEVKLLIKTSWLKQTTNNTPTK
ncbi:hypothetical protein [Malacoplasma muris]|uniref:hypothetical protein n=1 Tax=Malacoplasma muris TaxID=2119 RepID=UPI00398E88FA